MGPVSGPEGGVLGPTNNQRGFESLPRFNQIQPSSSHRLLTNKREHPKAVDRLAVRSWGIIPSTDLPALISTGEKSRNVGRHELLLGGSVQELGS